MSDTCGWRGAEGGLGGKSSRRGHSFEEAVSSAGTPASRAPQRTCTWDRKAGISTLSTLSHCPGAAQEELQLGTNATADPHGAAARGCQHHPPQQNQVLS